MSRLAPDRRQARVSHPCGLIVTDRLTDVSVDESQGESCPGLRPTVDRLGRGPRPSRLGWSPFEMTTETEQRLPIKRLSEPQAALPRRGQQGTAIAISPRPPKRPGAFA